MNPNIPILDLKPEIDARMGDYLKATERVLQSGHFILGPEVKAFESEVAAYLGVKHAIGCNSGTDALIIGLRAIGIQPGDEVLCPSFSFFATAESISLIGATPVFVDIDPKTMNLDPAQLQAKLSPRTRAIVPVHLFGHPAPMDSLLSFAQTHGLKVLEDVAQAFGADHGGKKVGTFGTLGAYSFFPSKNLGAFGDGGLMVTNDDAVAELCRKLRAHGSLKKYHNEMLGYNSRLDELQGAFLRIKLRHIEKANAGRRQAARRYAEVFSKMEGVTPPVEATNGTHVYHQYTVRIAGGKRDRVHEKLGAAGISTMIYYPVPIHRLPVYRDQKHSLPHTEKAAEEVLSLPIWPEITPEIQIRVADTLQTAIREA